MRSLSQNLSDTVLHDIINEVDSDERGSVDFCWYVISGELLFSSIFSVANGLCLLKGS